MNNPSLKKVMAMLDELWNEDDEIPDIPACTECNDSHFIIVCEEEGIKQPCPICSDFENFMSWREAHRKSESLRKEYEEIMEEAIETLGGFPGLGELVTHLKKEGYFA